jgi:arabinofuranosyltransferase
LASIAALVQRAALTAWAVAAAAAAALVLHARAFLPFISDDALISLRYAERLLDGDGLTWTDGERVEGYASLLWVLGVAALSPLAGGDLIVAARVLGVAATAAVVAALLFAFWPRRPRELVAPAAAALVLAACAPVAVWAIGGLEEPLVAGLLAWSLALALPLADASAPARARRVLVAGAPLALLCLARPDGALLPFAIGLGLLIARPLGWPSLRLVLVLAILPAVAVAGQLAFRLAYHGEWVPNAAHAQGSFSELRLLGGIDYVTGGARAIPVLGVAVLLAVVLLFVRTRWTRAAVLLLPGLVWVVYVALIGGDVLPAYRHLVPLVVVAVFLVAEAAAALASVGARVPAGAAALVLVPITFLAGYHHPEVERARTEPSARHGEIVGDMLRRAFAAQAPRIAVESAGTIPYFSKLPALDLHGLGDGAAALRREPDLVLLCGPRGPLPVGAEHGCTRSGKEMVAAPAFRRDYAKVILETPPPDPLHVTIWVRWHGRVGLRERAGRIEIPGLLFSANPETAVRADRDGALEATVSPGRPARIAGLAVPAGSWRLEALTTGRARARVAHPDGTTIAEGVPPLAIDLVAPGELTIEVLPRRQEEIGLAEVVLSQR